MHDHWYLWYLWLQMALTNVDHATDELLPAAVYRCSKCNFTASTAPDPQGKLKAVASDSGERIDLYCHPKIVKELTAGRSTAAWGEPGSEARAALRAQLEHWLGKPYCFTITTSLGKFYLNNLNGLAKMPETKRQKNN